MITRILKTGGDNFFVNHDDSISMKYDPLNNKLFKIINKDDDGNVNIKEIPIDDIKIQIGGQIMTMINGVKYIIDDGFRNKLEAVGYIYLDTDATESIIVDDNVREIKFTLLRDLKKYAIQMMNEKSIIKSVENNTSSELLIVLEQAGYKITIEIETINHLIDKNLKRGKNNLPLYPYNRDIDKNLGLYFKVFFEKIDSSCAVKNSKEMNSFAVDFIRNLVSKVKTKEDLHLDAILSDNELFDNLLIRSCRITKVYIKWEDDM